MSSSVQAVIYDLSISNDTVNMNDTVDINDTAIDQNFVLDGIQDFRYIPTLMVISALLLLPFGILMQLLIVIYERFEMDSMKRHLYNQLMSSVLLWTTCLSLVSIMRFILTLLDAFQPLWLMIALDYLRRACILAAFLIPGESLIFYYYSELILQRTPNWDHDFLSIWLHLSNVAASLFLCGVQTFLHLHGLQLR